MPTPYPSHLSPSILDHLPIPPHPPPSIPSSDRSIRHVRRQRAHARALHHIAGLPPGARSHTIFLTYEYNFNKFFALFRFRLLEDLLRRSFVPPRKQREKEERRRREESASRAADKGVDPTHPRLNYGS